MTEPVAATEVGGDLVVFLLARIGEDEQAAQAAHYEGQRWITEEEGVYRWPDDEAVYSADRKRDAAHIVRHDPARVLADIAAKRRIIELHTGDHECSTYDHNGDIDHCTWVIGDCSTLQLLALPYADHPDYDPSWAIE